MGAPAEKKICSICKGAVYAVEMQMIDEKPYHKDCVKCNKCGKRLYLSNLATYNGDFYCKIHLPVLEAQGTGKLQLATKSIDKLNLRDVQSAVVGNFPADEDLNVDRQTTNRSDPYRSNSTQDLTSGQNFIQSPTSPNTLAKNMFAIPNQSSQDLLNESKKNLGLKIETKVQSSTSVEDGEPVQSALEVKHELLSQSYNQVKIYSVKLLQCCARLASITQDGRIALLQEFVSQFRMTRDCLRRFIDATSSISSTFELRRNGVDMLKYEILMTSEFLLGNGTSPNAEEFKHLIENMNTNIDLVMKKYLPPSKIMVKTAPSFKEETCFDNSFVIPEEVNYAEIALEHLPDTHYYRNMFVGKEHSTFMGTVEKYGPVIISIRKEEVSAEKSNDSKDTAYRIIFRTKTPNIDRRVTHFSSELKKSFLGRKPSPKQILSLLDKEINFSKLKMVDPDPLLETRILSLDEFKVRPFANKNRPKVKFGVVLCKPNQTKDDEYFQNLNGSPMYNKFLTVLGDKVALQGYQGFSAGLDTQYGKTGTHMLKTKWREFDIVFHVSTFLPYNAEDPQQIERKRHIGNDILNLVYLDGDMQFDPSSIKTQFTHIYIIVKHEVVMSEGKQTDAFRVAVTSSVDVPKFGPHLPNPPVFTDMKRLYQFLMAKMTNGESAALKAPKFAKPNDRAFDTIFDNTISEFTSNEKKLKTSEAKSPIQKVLSTGSSDSKRQSMLKTNQSMVNITAANSANHSNSRSFGVLPQRPTSAYSTAEGPSKVAALPQSIVANLNGIKENALKKSEANTPPISGSPNTNAISMSPGAVTTALTRKVTVKNNSNIPRNVEPMPINTQGKKDLPEVTSADVQNATTFFGEEQT